MAKQLDMISSSRFGNFRGRGSPENRRDVIESRSLPLNASNFPSQSIIIPHGFTSNQGYFKLPFCLFLAKLI